MVDWLEIGQTSGYGDKLILVRATENETVSARTTSLVLSGNTQSINIPVQQGVEYISIVPDVYTFPASGGTAEFVVKSKGNWRVTQRPDWITVNPSSGIAGTHTITATCATNTEYEPRVSGITVYYSYSKTASTIITQEERVKSVIVDPTYFRVPRTGGTYTFQVTATMPWSISGNTFATVTPSAGTAGVTTVTMTLDENTGDTLIKKSFYVYTAEESVPVTVRQATYDYLTFEVTEAGQISIAVGNNFVKTYMSKNGNPWTEVTTTQTYEEVKRSVVEGDDVQFRATRDTTTRAADYIFAGATCGFKLSGNIMSMVDAVNFENIYTTPEPRGNAGYFDHCFNGCYKLNNIDDLRLPATSLTYSCYSDMFHWCSGLTSAAISLPATELADRCYYNMFGGSKIETGPSILPATTLAVSCYTSMFAYTKISTPPTICATTLADYCCMYMFEDCHYLTSAPRLMATTMKHSCYRLMFRDCYQLETAPTLPGTSLAYGCYIGMFDGCTSLTTAPALPATTLETSCYGSMFYGCTGLTTAPVLSATTLVSDCYGHMFYGCTNISRIKCLATNPSSSYTNNWVAGVASNGTFTKASGSIWETGIHGIPENWTVVEV